MDKEEVDRQFKIAVDQLKGGAMIITSTDAEYGLLCDASQESAVSALLKSRGNEGLKEMVVLVNSDRLFNQCVGDIPEVTWDLVDQTSQPLNLILDASKYLPESIRPDGKVSIRYVKKGHIAELINRINRPLLCVPMDPQEAEKSDRIKGTTLETLYIDLPTSRSKTAKVIQLESNGRFEILRK